MLPLKHWTLAARCRNQHFVIASIARRPFLSCLMPRCMSERILKIDDGPIVPPPLATSVYIDGQRQIVRGWIFFFLLSSILSGLLSKVTTTSFLFMNSRIYPRLILLEIYTPRNIESYHYLKSDVISVILSSILCFHIII